MSSSGSSLPLSVLSPFTDRPHSLALSIKMNLLLYLPALLYLLFTSLGALPTLLHLSLISLIQVSLATPFLTSRQAALTYLHSAFNFSREFLWEWTVNWRWLGEEAFESIELSRGLLVGHVLVLVLFGAAWAEKEGGVRKLLKKGLWKPMEGAVLGRPSADCECLPLLRTIFADGQDAVVVTVLFTSNLVGILFARSLHYQFYAWYAHQIVFLAWHTPFDLLQRSVLPLPSFVAGLTSDADSPWSARSSTRGTSTPRR